MYYTLNFEIEKETLQECLVRLECSPFWVLS